MKYSNRWCRSKYLVILFSATTALQLLWLIFAPMNAVRNAASIPGWVFILEPDVGSEFMKVRIAAALLLISVALWLPTRKSFFLSYGGMSWVGIEYIRWWIISFAMVRNSEILSFAGISHKAFLYNASWWDLWILAVTIAVFVGEIRTLRRFPSHAQNGSQVTAHS